jgi:hypothetical protein
MEMDMRCVMYVVYDVMIVVQSSFVSEIYDTVISADPN